MNLNPELEALTDQLSPRGTARTEDQREGEAIAAISRMLSHMDQAAQERIALWVVSKYGA